MAQATFSCAEAQFTLRRLLEIVRWTISTAVAFPAGKAIPPGGTTYFLLKKKVSKENFSESDCVAFSKCTVFPA
ncbi:hypothetical protein [Butyricicoccus pullicaecorum]|uniref:hypothetical protein n=1 Tax=Butyricicoccus pullicaecorum TaxID=501571 RepID=UPI003990CB19